ncbi:glucose/galactose MFS transporter [Massilia putida]|uniref:glucose/galactose MFS transporter n=1 Tax=Massilia putida TaxID=1141883 RepID=UPI00095328C1|nr:glucose/galactose MFS transporter [Massilia putida]
MVSDNARPAPARADSTLQVVLAMLFIGMLFFIVGCATWINGSLIPFLKIVCNLNNFQALWVTFAFYIAYTVMALPAAAVLARTGYRRGMALGLGIMSLGALLFIPAARSGLYALFLLALFTLATGTTLMQTAVNPYIVCIGARDSAAMRISIMGLFNKTAGVLVPILFSSVVLSGMEGYSEQGFLALDEAGRAALRAALAERLVRPYALMAGILLAVTVVVALVPLREIAPEGAGTLKPTRFGVLRFPQLVLGALALFAYVGVEVIAGDTIGLYGRHLGVPGFASLTSFTMAFMAVGYVCGVVAIPRWLSQKRALQLSAAAGMLLTLGVTLGSSSDTTLSRLLLGWTALPQLPDTVLCLAMLGFANALVWPAIWPLALDGLGPYTASGSALLIMGIAGGALLPILYGALSDHTGVQAGYWLLLPCYVWILFYAFKGHALRAWRRDATGGPRCG